MPRSRSPVRRSRSRDKDRKRRDKDRRRSRSKSYERREKDRDRRRSRSRSYDRKDRDRRRRDRSKSYDKRSHRYRSRTPDRKKERIRDKSNDNLDKRNSQRSSDSTSSSSIKPIVIIANVHSKGNKNKSTTEMNAQKNRDHREIFEISNEFSREGFEQFSKDHGIDFSKIETDEDREAVHEKMQELLKAHFAAQGIIYPPPPKEEKQPAINAATGFVNDGSFLEQFKRMQEEQKLQAELEQKRKAESLLNLPIRRRRAGKILKTGVVAKTKVTNQDGSADMPSNAWGMYFKEVQKYKGSSCDTDSKNRPLVK